MTQKAAGYKRASGAMAEAALKSLQETEQPGEHHQAVVFRSALSAR